MAAVDERLVDPAGKLIRLFTPPFDQSALEPGYIKGYVPGIRENGGQYTHGVTWVALAAALQGRGDRAVELWSLLNPINHARTPEEVAHYKVEPYVVCADVYGAPPHVGRGGWTWYTGAAGWMYRVAVEAILGVHVRGDSLRFEPCIPPGWPGYEVMYRFGSATYHVHVDNSAGVGRGVRSITTDGRPADGGAVPLRDDGQAHEVRVALG
jgi:cellobiose phosphorylase